MTTLQALLGGAIDQKLVWDRGFTPQGGALLGAALYCALLPGELWYVLCAFAGVGTAADFLAAWAHGSPSARPKGAARPPKAKAPPGAGPRAQVEESSRGGPSRRWPAPGTAPGRARRGAQRPARLSPHGVAREGLPAGAARRPRAS
ncbi:unnamed protein product [Prorocentrum cordatum]|uniref:Phosphatidate cytidylyltransferase n=1 Tax=Prorocentrum cordatum TaxID=2364126 RepID=A0ABN9VFU8_9DINO|nr:unnamed protein product [Polarella glacialis]